MSPTYSICKDHGYLTGEQTTCPYCHQKTEVYSRITGYYRPVQNWNDGKVQEYKDRRVYNIGHSVLTHTGPNPAPVDEKPVYDVSAAADRGIAAALNTIEMEYTAKKTAAAGQTSAEENKDDSVLLFKTATCPNCKAAVSMLNKAGVHYTEVMAEDAEALVEKYSIRTAPTLVLLKNEKDGNGGESFETYRGLSDIRGWLNQSASV